MDDGSLPPMDLRQLRLWHWNKVVSYRDLAMRHDAYAAELEKVSTLPALDRYNRSRARNAHKRANWHLGAVQALNDVVTGTAERDAAGRPCDSNELAQIADRSIPA